MSYLKITAILQQMSQPLEHLAFKKFWENVKANTAAHPRCMLFLPCAATPLAHLQRRKRRDLL